MKSVSFYVIISCIILGMIFDVMGAGQRGRRGRGRGRNQNINNQLDQSTSRIQGLNAELDNLSQRIADLLNAHDNTINIIINNIQNTYNVQFTQAENQPPPNDGNGND
uniref:DUF148 domain-containing protein n=1 Tax=Meloidogyne hapla TaxID=6305 RepID=A0A1I8BSB1_MELHA